MNTTIRITTAERFGRWLGRGWGGYVRGEGRVSNGLVSKGVPRGGATALVWVVKLAVLGLLLYVAFWLLRTTSAGRSQMNCEMARRALVCIRPTVSGSTLTIRTIRSMTR